MGIVTLVTYFLTYPDLKKGIVSTFPLWILPVVIARLVSLVFYWKEKRKAASLVYIIGTLGVLIGTDCLYLISLLENEIHTTRNAVIGGTRVFDRVFINGILADLLEVLLIFQQKRKKGEGGR
jgi:uncharacterized membrane protein